MSRRLCLAAAVAVVALVLTPQVVAGSSMWSGTISYSSIWSWEKLEGTENPCCSKTVQTESATWTLRPPTVNRTVYGGVGNVKGRIEDTQHCTWLSSAFFTAITTWEGNISRESGVFILEQDRESGAWLFNVWGATSGPNPFGLGDAGSAPMIVDNSACPNSGGIYTLDWTHSVATWRMGQMVLVDADPDPGHLVGTTTGRAFYDGSPIDLAEFNVTVSYDLRLAATCPTRVEVVPVWRPWTLTVDFAATVGGGSDLRYDWSFGDGTTEQTTTATVVHDYASPGLVVPTVTVTSAGGTCAPISAPAEVVVDPIDVFAPSIKFHPDEKYFGGDPNDFLAVSKLRWLQKRQKCPQQGSPAAVVAKAGAVNPLWLAGEGGVYKALGMSEECDARRVLGHSPPSLAGNVDENGYGFVLDAPKSVRPGNTTSPLYAEYVDPPGKNPYILYWLWYPHNEWRGVCVGPPPLRLVGVCVNAVREVHEGDWEHVVVRVNPDTLKAETVAFYRHYCVADEHAFGSLDGDPTEPTHFVVYAARGGHASFAHGKKRPQGSCSVSYDRTGLFNDSGKVWRPWENGPIRDATKQPWYGFGGHWGNNGPSTPIGPIDNYGPPGPGPTRSGLQDSTKEGRAIPKGWG